MASIRAGLDVRNSASHGRDHRAGRAVVSLGEGRSQIVENVRILAEHLGEAR